MANVTGLKSIVMTSDDPARLAAFYRDVLEIPFEKEEHEGGPTHWACRLGAVHFAIHARDRFKHASSAGGNDTVVTFSIGDRDALVSQLRAHSVAVIDEMEIGPMKFVTFRDPDGRVISCGTAWRPGA
jgi:predicted enzyme related to lactoylglutathione lyase